MDGVRVFLDNINMGKYWGVFKTKGYDREDDVMGLDEDDMDQMGIANEDRNMMLEAAAMHRPSEQFGVHCWLLEHGLAYYEENFTANDLTDLRQLAAVELDDSTFTDLEIVIPGHRKRLRRAVAQLRKRRRSEEAEDPVTEGYWGKPGPLKEATNDFLCVRASVISTKPHRQQVALEFMVDSGSDVMTVRKEVLETLDTEFLGTIQSRGIHATRRKQLHRCRLQIGAVQLETDVIADNYDSIGNDVIRNFRHYISSKRHFWLKGDQTTNPSHVSGDASCAEPTKCHPHSGTIPKATSDDNVSSTDPT
ncbi:hypothetical protein NP493_148g01039 [Ridgeia piscesae]|uniref:SAM domain-containing protein n=1 Tax=Ridgeia piscesae TaxID=27915 RepID=A0AAD9P4P4_RIDPI|nr:hypothetical protein NP493_148g01039 [Ridgeia piscesae]